MTVLRTPRLVLRPWRVGLDEVVAFAVPANERSLAVMRRLGVARDEAGGFDHPLVPADSPLRRHVLYRLTAAGRASRPEPVR